MFEIENSVALPASGRGRPPKYPFHAMEVGQSVFVEGQTTQGLAPMAARLHGKAHGKTFTSRSQDGGVRIWRVA